VLVVNGDVAYAQDLYVALLPYINEATRNSDNSIEQMAGYCMSLLSWTVVPSRVHAPLLKALVHQTETEPSRYIRQTAVGFLHTWLPRHAFSVLNADVKTIWHMAFRLLRDPSVDVRNTTSGTIASLVAAIPVHLPGIVNADPAPAPSTSTSLSSPVVNGVARLPVAGCYERSVKAIIRHFQVLCKVKLREGDEKTKAAAMATRHGGVMGLVTLVVLHPYDVPPHIPGVLAYLSGHVSDPSPIDSIVKKLFADFKRTHQEQWEEFRNLFSADELDAFESVSVAQSYFV